MEGPADLEQWPWKSQQTFDVSGVDFLRNMGCLLRMGVCETLMDPLCWEDVAILNGHCDSVAQSEPGYVLCIAIQHGESESSQFPK